MARDLALADHHLEDLVVAEDLVVLVVLEVAGPVLVGPVLVDLVLVGLVLAGPVLVVNRASDRKARLGQANCIRCIFRRRQFPRDNRSDILHNFGLSCKSRHSGKTLCSHSDP